MIYFDSEKALEDLFTEHRRHFFNELVKGDSKEYRFMRQPKLGAYGFGDIIYVRVTADEWRIQMDVDLIELKNTEIKYEHIGQVSRYRQLFKDIGGCEIATVSVNFKAHLIGLKTNFAASGDLCYLAQSIDWLRVYEIKIHPVDGMRLDQVDGYSRSHSNEKGLVEFIVKVLELYPELGEPSVFIMTNEESQEVAT
jgi:hypothetical protein